MLSTYDRPIVQGRYISLRSSFLPRLLDPKSISRKMSIGIVMKPKIVRASSLKEVLTPERCFVSENLGLLATGDKQVSIARARVKPSVTTKTHHLEGVQEIYLIVKGSGIIHVSGLEPAEVAESDAVVIPGGLSQKMANVGKTDLVFYCICTPAFTQDCYRDEETKIQQ